LVVACGKYQSEPGPKGNPALSARKYYGCDMINLYQKNIMNYYLEAFKRYIDFKGRSSRSEYWYFFLFNSVIIFLLSFFDGLFGMYNTEMNFGLLSGLYQLAALLPGLGVAVRRLHDTGHSAWFLLIILIPLVGPIVFIILMATASSNEKNNYGPVPKKLVVVRKS